MFFLLNFAPALYYSTDAHQVKKQSACFPNLCSLCCLLFNLMDTAAGARFRTRSTPQRRQQDAILLFHVRDRSECLRNLLAHQFAAAFAHPRNRRANGDLGHA